MKVSHILRLVQQMPQISKWAHDIICPLQKHSSTEEAAMVYGFISKCAGLIFSLSSWLNWLVSPMLCGEPCL